MRRCLVLFILLWVSKGLAGGFIDNVDGDPYKWVQGSTINYKVDDGVVSSSISNAQGHDLIEEAFDIWEGVSVASGLAFNDAGDVGADITGGTSGNWGTYFEITSEGLFNVLGDDSIIFFDADGAWFSQFFGSSAEYVLGISSPAGYESSTRTISKGIAILNGMANPSSNQLKVTMTHEFGHFLNLAHTQLNWEDWPTDSNGVLPTMFPYLSANSAASLTLHPDDEAALAYLYPNSSALAGRGEISGKLTRKNGDAVRAVLVNCRSTEESRENAVSYISDQTLEGDGNYRCGALTPGTYTVDIEPISVAINFFDPDPPLVTTEFYNGESESFDPEIDDRDDSTNVTATAGETTPDIDVVINEDGRLVSGEALTGEFRNYPWLANVYTDVDYFITVPEGATRVVFELSSPNGTVDVDLFGRCDQPFALTGDLGLSDPIYTTTAGASMQAEFAEVSGSGTETKELTGSTTPALQACTYHLLVSRSPTHTTTFSLKATIEGVNPKFRVKQGPGNVVFDGVGEILVMSRTLLGSGDTFELTSLVVTDLGIGPLYRLQAATLYLDVDQNGEVSDEDRVLATTDLDEVDPANRRIPFIGLKETFEDGVGQTYLMTYTVYRATARSTPLAIFVVGLLFSAALFRFQRKMRRGVGLVALVLIGLSCGDKSTKVFEPIVATESDVTVQGETFGSSVNVSVGPINSVKDFFE